MPTTSAFLALSGGYQPLERLAAAAYNAVVAAVESGRASRSAINAAGTGTYTLSSTEYQTVVLECTGILTGNRVVQVPLTAGARWLVYNGTSGAYTLTVQGSSGTGIAIAQGSAAWVWTDGVNVLRGSVDTEQDGDLGANTVNTAAIEDLAVTLAKIADGILTGLKLATVANANVIGGVPVVHRVIVPAGATGDVDVVLTHKTRITDVHLVKTTAAGGGAGTIQVKNGANAITDAMSINVADQTVVRPTTIDDAYWEIAAAGTLRISRTRTASTDESCEVVVSGIRVA